MSEQDSTPDQSSPAGPSRRTFIAGASAAGIGAASVPAARGGRALAAQSKLIDKALAASVSSASLSDIQHVVILMQENRSFDHYFGTMSGVRGFSDPAVLQQTVGGSQYPVFDSSATSPARVRTRPATCSPSTCSTTRPWRTARPPTTSPMTGRPSTRAGTTEPWTRS
jgi:phospholipase C